MCGIAGSFGCTVNIEAMLDRIAHRGPDSRGVASIGALTLGHVRLAIQDTDNRAAQPMTVDGVTVAYNGEAWNTEELRASLPDREWNTTSDTEPIAALLSAHGPAALNRIDGMFAIAWTGPSGTYVARDRYGKIPLYFARRRDGWLFSSEIKGLDRGTRALSVEPGTAVRLDDGTVTRWAVPLDPGPCDPATVRELLRDGVRQRLLSDRPVCFLLSGGLDSSLVLALARELHPDPVAYTAVYDSDSADLVSARRIAAHLDVPLVEVPVPSPTSESIGEAVRVVEVPMKAQVEIAVAHLPLMRRIAADGYRVALSGEAADELFCGYGNMMLQAAKAADYPSVIRSAVEKMARGNFVRVNKVMMAAGVEGRLPFMEERLVATLMSASKDDNPPGKKLLKAAASELLPSWVIRRPKETFQGGTGVAAAVSRVVSNPVRYYNAEAVSAFGYLPKG